MIILDALGNKLRSNEENADIRYNTTLTDGTGVKLPSAPRVSTRGVGSLDISVETPTTITLASNETYTADDGAEITLPRGTEVDVYTLFQRDPGDGHQRRSCE